MEVHASANPCARKPSRMRSSLRACVRARVSACVRVYASVPKVRLELGTEQKAHCSRVRILSLGHLPC